MSCSCCSCRRLRCLGRPSLRDDRSEAGSEEEELLIFGLKCNMFAAFPVCCDMNHSEGDSFLHPVVTQSSSFNCVLTEKSRSHSSSSSFLSGNSVTWEKKVTTSQMARPISSSLQETLPARFPQSAQVGADLGCVLLPTSPCPHLQRIQQVSSETVAVTLQQWDHEYLEGSGGLWRRPGPELSPSPASAAYNASAASQVPRGRSQTHL